MRIERSRGAGGWGAAILGIVFALVGIILAGGGAWLAVLGGSWYYLLAGLGLLISGFLLIRGRMSGAWLYLLVYVATVAWALWEVGLNGWALVPRLVAPTVLLVLLALVSGGLAERRGGRVTGLSLLGVVGLIAVGAIVVMTANRPGAPGAFSAPLAATPGDPAILQTGADWPAWGGTYHAQRYSPLNQITAENVGQLERVWMTRTGDMPSEAASGKYGAENTPLKVGDTLYLCSAKGIVIAVDAATGREQWRYDPKVSDEAIPYTAACRGVAYHDTRLTPATATTVPATAPAAVARPNTTSVVPPPSPAPAPTTPSAPAGPAAPAAPCETRIIWGTLDARLIAVDARTGQPCAGFGTGGQVDTTLGMGPTVPGMISITSAPTIVRGVVVTGHQILDGQRNNAPSGVIKGYDAMTGALRWAWDLARPDITTAPPEGQIYTLGTPNMWTTASGDEQLGLVYLPMGNSAADYYSADRSEAENRYATSLVALDVTTGKPAWSFQTVHKDVWDYDLGSQGTLVDFPTAAGTTPAIILPSKQGDIYVLDRRTGQPITRVVERPAPQGGVEPAQRSRTQPHSLYHTLRPADDLTERDMWGMSPIDQMICRIQFRSAAYDGFYTPPTSDRHWIQYPGYNGGSDWGGVAVDPVRGVIIANYNDMPNYNRLVPREEANERGWFPRGHPQARKGGAEGAGDPQLGVPYAISVNAGWRMPFTGMLCKQPPYGGIRAIDLRTGRTLWDRPLGTARKNGPFGIPSMLPIDIGTPNNGGSVVTAGGLIFVAAATDDLIRAIDIRTGETVWSDVLPAGGQAAPMTYEVNGRQFIVMAPGGHHFMETPIGDQVIAYALPENRAAS